MPSRNGPSLRYEHAAGLEDEIEWRLVRLESEAIGDVVGGSTSHLAHHDHIDDQHRRRHHHAQHYLTNVVNDMSLSCIYTGEVDSLGNQRERCQTDNDFPCSAGRTQHVCL